MELDDLIRHSERSIQNLDRQIDGLEISSCFRNRLAGGCLEVALEHQKAIVLLAARRLHGSAFSLARVLFEAFVRGVWLNRCAKDIDLANFEKERLNKKFEEILSDVEGLEGFEARVLSDIKRRSWKVMNSFTHTGFHQVVRRQTETTIESSYEVEEIIEVIDFANAVGFMSAIEIALLAGNAKLANDLLGDMKQMWPTQFEQLPQPA
jgi:hypothetical protein